MKRFVLLLAALVSSALLGGCGSSSTSADAAPDFTAIPGDSVVTLAWTAQPGVDYWLFYGAGSSVTSTNWASVGGKAVINATSPYTITGLTNGSTYSFTMNARKNGGPGGPGAPTQVVSPRFAGSKWTVGTPLGTGRLNGIAAFSATNVVVGSGGTIFAGTTAATTVAQTNPAAPADLNAVVYGGLGFVAVGAAGTIISSTDSTTWVTRSSGTIASLNAIASVGTGAFVAVGAAGTALVSTDATTWKSAASATTQDLYAAAYGAGLYVAVGAGGAIMTSPDGTTWTARASNTTNDLRAVGLGVFTTTTGSGLTAVVTSTNLFVATGVAGTLVTSTDGLTWTARAPISPTTMNAVSFGGQFVAVGNAGKIFTSLDGISWTAQVSGTTNDLTALVRTTTGYTAVGAAGTVLTSF